MCVWMDGFDRVMCVYGEIVCVGLYINGRYTPKHAPHKHIQNLQHKQLCGTDPMTGFTREGCCTTGPQDFGSHTVSLCSLMDLIYGHWCGGVK